VSQKSVAQTQSMPDRQWSAVVVDGSSNTRRNAELSQRRFSCKSRMIVRPGRGDYRDGLAKFYGASRSTDGQETLNIDHDFPRRCLRSPRAKRGQ